LIHEEKSKLSKSDSANKIQLERLQSDIEYRDTQLNSSLEHISLLEKQISFQTNTIIESDKKMRKLQEENLQTLEIIQQMQLALNERECPKVFDVILRCSDGDKVWCLIKV